MATEAEATREARAKVIAAEGEQRAARAIKGAADIIGSSPCAIQLRYLQTLNNIATEKNSTIIFPVPIELFETFRNGFNNMGASAAHAAAAAAAAAAASAAAANSNNQNVAVASEQRQKFAKKNSMRTQDGSSNE